MPRRTWGWFLLAVILNYLLFRSLLPSTAPVAVPYTFFKEEVHKDNVKAIYSQGQTVTGKFSSPVNYPPPSPVDPKSSSSAEPKKVTDFTTILPTFVDPGLEAFLIEHKVEISAEPIQEGSSPLATLIFGLLARSRLKAKTRFMAASIEELKRDRNALDRMTQRDE